MNGYRVAVYLTSAAVATAIMPMTAQASTNLELRKKVIGLTGIMGVTGTDALVTRGEFASMLAKATSNKSMVTKTSATSVFADVSQNHTYASAIRIAAENGWMSGYLGGVFRPDEFINLQEAVRSVLALLGYTNEDFTGDQNGGRLSKYYALELSDGIVRDATEVLTKEDCINLFYNMLCTETKGGTVYCKNLGYELTSDGELNPLTIADNSLKGPRVVKRSESLDDKIPFSLEDATFYLNGSMASLESVKQAKQNEGFIVIYYNTSAKTVWAYGGDEDSTDRRVIRGTVSGIYYSSSDVLTPSGLQIDDDNSVTYKLTNSEMQFAFSIYGTVKTGDDVILICQVITGADGEESFTVLDYIED